MNAIAFEKEFRHYYRNEEKREGRPWPSLEDGYRLYGDKVRDRIMHLWGDEKYDFTGRLRWKELSDDGIEGIRGDEEIWKTIPRAWEHGYSTK